MDSVYDEGTETWIDIYDWVYIRTDRYIARDEILGYLNTTDTGISDYLPEQLIALAQSKAADASFEDWRYTPAFSTNTDFGTVLRSLIGMSEADIARVLELYEAAYMEQFLSPEALARIRAIQAASGMYQYVDWDGDYTSYEGVTFVDGEIGVVYYNQLDTRWKDQQYGTDTIGGYACGPTAMSIVVSTLTGINYDPVYMANWAVANGYWCRGNGSYHTLIPGAAESFGLTVSGCTPSEPQRILDALSSGKLVVALMARGHFTSGGHYIVLRGITADGKILVADPASYARSLQAWSMSIILSEARTGAGAGGPFWIIGS